MLELEKGPMTGNEVGWVGLRYEGERTLYSDDVYMLSLIRISFLSTYRSVDVRSTPKSLRLMEDLWSVKCTLKDIKNVVRKFRR